MFQVILLAVYTFSHICFLWTFTFLSHALTRVMQCRLPPAIATAVGQYNTLKGKLCLFCFCWDCTTNNAHLSKKPIKQTVHMYHLLAVPPCRSVVVVLFADWVQHRCPTGEHTDNDFTWELGWIWWWLTGEVSEQEACLWSVSKWWTGWWQPQQRKVFDYLQTRLCNSESTF